MADENQASAQGDAKDQSKSKRTRVTFTKNVKFNWDRYKKGDSLLLEKEKVDQFKEAGVIE
ncbi:hypothetical protein ABES38_11745 [Bacillus gobiensis]|uniref:DUF7210 family protein n=1 Tax=Bacillus gobiensis TaxID=1441095 RepID=UPI003D250DD1